MNARAFFADTSGTVVVTITPEFSGPGILERRTARGELIEQSSLVGFRPPAQYNFMLVDGGALLLRRTGTPPTEFGVVPSAAADGVLTRRVVEWLRRSGGIFEDGHSGGGPRTNPDNDYSCAVGADRSVAIWNFRDPNSFLATPQGTFEASVLGDMFCVVADGRPAVLVYAMGRTAAVGGSRMLIFENGRQVATEGFEFPPPLSSQELSPSFQQTASALHVIARQLGRRRELSRIVRREGVWRIETVQADPRWPDRHEIIWLDEQTALVGDPATNEIHRAHWPRGASVATYESEVVARADSALKRNAFSGGVTLSASADYFLWESSDNEFLIEAVDLGGAQR